MFKSVPISTLKVGAELSHPVYADDHRNKLLGVGTPIDDGLLNRLKQRGIRSVVLHESDLAQLSEKNPGRDSNMQIEACAACHLPLPLRLPRSGEHAISWVCTGCGASYEAVLDHTRVSDNCVNVRPRKFDIDRTNLVHPPQRLVEVVSRIIGREYKGLERRITKRHSVKTCVAVIPVDHEYCPIGEPFVVITRNISTDGIEILHTSFINAKFLVVELPGSGGKPFQAVVKLLHCRRVDFHYEFGGEFVIRLAD